MTKKVLLASGILAAIAVIFRGSVTLGLYLGILPGLVLAVAPTVFLYTGAFVLVRNALRSRLRLGGAKVLNATAAVLTVAAGFALAAPAVLDGRRAVAAAARDDVTPSAPVRLEGDVRLDRFGSAWSPRTRSKTSCDALCAALLDTPGVRSVTIGGAESAAGASLSPLTYRLVPKDAARAETLMPADPAGIVDHLPNPERGDTSGRPQWKEALEAKKALKDSVTAKWSLRLSHAETLVAEPPLTTFDRTIVIRDLQGGGMHRIGVTEVEIVDARGDVLLRRQRVTAAPVAAPLHVTPSGPMLDRGFEIGRSTVYTGPRYYDFKPVEILFLETTLARPAADKRAVGRLRDAIAASPSGSSTAAMVAPWLATLDWQHLEEKDVDVLAKLIADPRTTGLERLYDGYATNVSPRLRRPIAVRLLASSTDDRLRSTLNTLVRNMPPGTYAELLPEENALLADHELRLRSSALVARLADQGARAVPLLVQLLSEDVQVQPWARRRLMLDDVRRAFSILGRDAASALPTVERLFEMPRSPLTNTSNDADDWRVAMVRMGKPVERLTFPSHVSPEIVARDRERIRKRADKGPEL